jgi:hypothetical protein
MKLKLSAFLYFLISSLGTVRAQDSSPAENLAGQVHAGAQPESAQPSTPPPEMLPPLPPTQPPAPPVQSQMQVQPQFQQPVERTPGTMAGQWVYTSDYGWLWMPYGSQYVYEGTFNDAYPYSYVYYPSYGWTWLAAPWVWGWGTYPYFGGRGPGGFGWYVGLHRAGYGWGGYRGGGPNRYGVGVGARGVGVSRMESPYHAISGARSSSGSFSRGGFVGHVGGGFAGHTGGGHGGGHR